MRQHISLPLRCATYRYEIRSEEAVFEEIPETKLPDKMIGLAATIIDKMTGEFEPKKFEDRYESTTHPLQAGGATGTRRRSPQCGQPMW